MLLLIPSKNYRPFKSTKCLNILGINSGTSADGIDFALVRFARGKPRIILSAIMPFGSRIKDMIVAAGEPAYNDGVGWLKLDFTLGKIIGEGANKFIARAAKLGDRVDLIATHGQTVRHLPDDNSRSITYQIGDASRVARITGLPVISDFRRSDTAAGGEGAPLSPILHEALFRHRRKWRAIINVGGISNVTVLPPQGSKSKPFAADCGPGNMLIDRAMRKFYNKNFDRNGIVASTGLVHSDIVHEILSEPFFSRRPPKSTGRELFGRPVFDKIIRLMKKAPPEDVISTLTEITVKGISDFLMNYAPKTQEIYLCGGGASNKSITKRLGALMSGSTVATTVHLSYDPDCLEALLWAYLAWRFVKGKPVSARHFTGAKNAYFPGKLCFP